MIPTEEGYYWARPCTDRAIDEIGDNKFDIVYLVIGFKTCEHCGQKYGKINRRVFPFGFGEDSEDPNVLNVDDFTDWVGPLKPPEEEPE